MGRPPKPPEQRKAAALTLRWTHAERDAAAIAARRVGLPLSDWVRQVIANAAATDNRPDSDFVSFHPVGDFAAVESYFSRYNQDGNTPLAIRIPLLDPDRFLERTAFLVRPLFGWFGALIWLSVVTLGLVLAGLNWTALTENVIDRVLAPQNLLLLWLIYPLVKAVHELGHAYATKLAGQEVHEIGVMILILLVRPQGLFGSRYHVEG